MRVLPLIAVVCFTLTSALGQDNEHRDLKDRFSYGLTPKLNVPTISSGDKFGAIGYELDLFSTIDLHHSPYKIFSSLGYARYGYESDPFRYNTDNVNLLLGLGLTSEKLGYSNIIIGYKPSFTLYATSNFLGLKNPAGPNFEDITKTLDNRFSSGVYTAFRFNLNDKSALEIGYTYFLNQDEIGGVLDAQPHNLSLGLNINLGKRWDYSNKYDVCYPTLSALQHDTLYFINRTCEGKLSNDQLDSMLSENYKFSNFKVLEDAEIAEVQKRGDAIHFAVIGRYYASEGDPETTGIYLLDSKGDITETPYPFYTFIDTPLVLDHCFGSMANIQRVIQKFNSRMFLTLENSTPISSGVEN